MGLCAGGAGGEGAGFVGGGYFPCAAALSQRLKVGADASALGQRAVTVDGALHVLHLQCCHLHPLLGIKVMVNTTVIRLYSI